jgi:ABC-type multidrug transport system ATPase subunit
MQDPLVVSDVWKSFGAVEAVKGLSLAVPAGSVYGFLGPNGAGKSTTILMMLVLARWHESRPFAQRSSSLKPVCLATRASIFGPIS